LPNLSLNDESYCGICSSWCSIYHVILCFEFQIDE
jgi:hypothetical protein